MSAILALVGAIVSLFNNLTSMWRQSQDRKAGAEHAENAGLKADEEALAKAAAARQRLRDSIDRDHGRLRDDDGFKRND